MRDKLELNHSIWFSFDKINFLFRSGSKAAATFKIEGFVIIVEAVNYYHKVLHLGCWSSPRSACSICNQISSFLLMGIHFTCLLLFSARSIIFQIPMQSERSGMFRTWGVEVIFKLLYTSFKLAVMQQFCWGF